MELYLIRHAQSQNNALPQEQRVEDAPLTELGHRQARQLADWIPRLQLTRLITSPFLRTLQTTSYVAQATGLQPTVRTALHELGGCVAGHEADDMVGRPGMTREQIQLQFPGYEIEEDIDGDGWWKSKDYETMHAARVRAEQLRERTRVEFGHTEEKVAYVMHADLKHLFLTSFHSEALDTANNTSISKVKMDPQDTLLEFFNRVEHLPQEMLTW